VALVASSPRVGRRNHEDHRVLRISHLLTVTFGWFVTSYLVSMLAWVFVPALVMGWMPTVIMSGSMAPAIRPGDVVLIDPNSTSRAAGAVLAFSMREGPTVIHRVARTPQPGIYVTKGDANVDVDSTPVPEAMVLGQGRLLVPFIGYPKVWVQDNGAPMVAAALGLLLVVGRKQRTTMVVAGGLLAGWLTFSATAAFADVRWNGQSGLGTTTVQPPTNLNGSCPAGVGIGNLMPVTLAWTASPTSGVTGYQVLYDAPPADGDFAQIGTVTAPQTSFTHNIPSGQLAPGQPHTYSVRSGLNQWVSADSAPETLTITEVVFVYVCS
jgi:signal peptidase I